MQITRSVTRRSVVGLIGGSAALVAAPALVSAQEKRVVKLLLDWTWWPPHVPIVTAIEKGFFDRAGLNVEIRQGTGSGTTSQVVGQGTYDIGHVNLSSAAQAIAKGVPIRAIATVTAMGPPGMVFRPGLVKKPSDVIGKRIGSTPGGSDSQILPAFLAANNIDPSQVRIVNMPGEAKLGALISGQIDIVSGDAIYFAALAGDKGLEVEHFGYGEHGANTIGYGFISNDAYMKNNGDTLRRFISAAMEGYRYTEANLPEAVAIYKKVTSSSQPDKTVQDVYKGYLTLLKYKAEGRGGLYTGRNDPAVWTQALDILSKYAGLTSTKPQSEYWTNQFLPS